MVSAFQEGHQGIKGEEKGHQNKKEEESKRKRSVPTVTLDETVTIEDVTDDETENVPTNFDDCNHGDLVDYMCMDCTLKRWETEWES